MIALLHVGSCMSDDGRLRTMFLHGGRGRKGMSDPLNGECLDPRHAALLQEVYEAACDVEAALPERHVASIAARKIIAAFRCECKKVFRRGAANFWCGTA